MFSLKWNDILKFDFTDLFNFYFSMENPFTFSDASGLFREYWKHIDVSCTYVFVLYVIYEIYKTNKKIDDYNMKKIMSVF